MNRIIQYGIEHETGLVVSRVGSEAAVPVLDFAAIGQGGDDFAPGDDGPRRVRVLELFPCAGGSTRGYIAAGARVIAVDTDRRALSYNPAHVKVTADWRDGLDEFGPWADFIHASPPCQGYSKTAKLNREASSSYPKLIEPVREALLATGKPFVIENVEGSPLVDPVTLCGLWFHDNGYPFIRTYRHRLFEAHGFELPQPPHLTHRYRNTKMGRRPEPGTFLHIVGNCNGVEECRQAMGYWDWVPREYLAEAIPPCYAEYIAEAFKVSERIAA